LSLTTIKNKNGVNNTRSLTPSPIEYRRSSERRVHADRRKETRFDNTELRREQTERRRA